MTRTRSHAASGPGYRRDFRLGDASAALAFNPATAAIGAGVSLATAAVNEWMNSIQLSHDADTATTLIVNGLASQLSNLDAAYLSAPASCASQRAALDAFDQAWQWLQSPAACGNPSYGKAGNSCITDRAPGGKYPWQTYYRNPIANDPRLVNAGCDTGQEVILPSLTTGQYSATGITSTGDLDTTVTGTAAPGASSAPSTTSAAAPGAVTSSIPPAYLIAAAVLAGVILFK